MAAADGNKVTSLDVARLARVSQSAVSRTFSPTRGAAVSPETRARVLAAAAELGYRPNIIARSMITRRTQMVGVVVTDLHNPYHPLLLEALTRALQATGRHALLFTGPTDGDVDTLLPRVLQFQVDAVIIAAGTLSSRMVDACARAATPVVLMNRIGGPGTDMVLCDNRGGAALAAQALHAAGCRRLALIGGRPDTFSDAERRTGFLDALATHGRTLHGEACGSFTYTGGAEAARTLLAMPERPDGLFCLNDSMALGAMDVARHECGLSVPGDLAVIGFDDLPEAARPPYALTTIRHSVEDMVTAVLACLERRLSADTALEPQSSHRVVLPATLVPRLTHRLEFPSHEPG